RLVSEVLRVLRVALGEEPQVLVDALGRLHEPFAVRVLADVGEDGADRIRSTAWLGHGDRLFLSPRCGSIVTGMALAGGAPTAHVDTFARDRLPPRALWPEMGCPNLPELESYPDRLNAAAALLDAAVAT